MSIRAEESGRYYIRLKKVPPKLDRDGNFVDQNGDRTDTPIPTPSDDPWWVRVRADGVVRYGEYDVDEDPTTGNADGHDITWVPLDRSTVPQRQLEQVGRHQHRCPR